MSDAISLLLWAAISCGALTGCGDGQRGDSSESSLNVILISMDTTRADHLGCYGHPSIRTPNIDKLAGEGTMFTQCTASVPVTLPSHSSILTGTHPYVHKVRDNGRFRLHADNLTLAEILRDAGYATAGQVGAFVLNRQFGIDQGFDTFRDVAHSEAVGPGGMPGTEISAEAVTDGAIKLLQEMSGGRFFLFVHYFDPHRPLVAPKRFASKYMDPYVAEIAYTDEQIGRLLAAVEQSGVADRTLIVLTADHGEGQGQHHEDTHGFFLYDATLTVPLIIHAPSVVPVGSVAAQVRTIDIAPTILSILKIPVARQIQGIDLMPLARGEQADPGLEAYSETFYPKYTYHMGFSRLRALRSGEWKYIHAPTPELYHVSVDPREMNNLAPTNDERVEQMRRRMQRMLADAPQVVEAAQARYEASADDVRALESLGYLGGGSVDPDDTESDELALFEPIGLNPMEHYREIRLATRAVAYAQANRQEDVERTIKELLAEAGDRADTFVWAHAQLGGALAAQRKLDEALVYFDKAVEGRPDDGQMQTMRGIVLRALNRDDEAIDAFRRAVKLEPVFAVTHLNLAEALVAGGATDQAIAQYQLAIKKDTQAWRAYTGFARLLRKTGHLKEARAVLNRAVTVARQSGDHQAAGQFETLRKQLASQPSAPPRP